MADCIVAPVEDPATPTRVLVGADAVVAYQAYRIRQLREWQAELATHDDTPSGDTLP